MVLTTIVEIPLKNTTFIHQWFILTCRPSGFAHFRATETLLEKITWVMDGHFVGTKQIKTECAHDKTD